jgi:hypothetical protein
MKARVASITGLALLLASAVGAQTKVSGQHTCPKPEVVGTTEVGDKPGHTMSIIKNSCPWTKPLEMAGEKSTDGTSYSFDEATSTRNTTNGTYVGNTNKGDKFFVSFHDSFALEDGKPQASKGTWSYTGGTGKLKGITGKGTYTVTPNADGTAVVDVEGEYAIPATAPKKATAKKAS